HTDSVSVMPVTDASRDVDPIGLNFGDIGHAISVQVGDLHSGVAKIKVEAVGRRREITRRVGLAAQVEPDLVTAPSAQTANDVDAFVEVDIARPRIRRSKGR